MTHLTVIYSPQNTCPIGPSEECEGGAFGVKPSDSNNWDFIVQGCKIHLSKADPTTFQLEFQQYGKAIIVRDERGDPVQKPHKKSDNSAAIYGPNYSVKELRGKSIMVNTFEAKRPKTEIIVVTSEEVVTYLVELDPKINPPLEEEEVVE